LFAQTAKYLAISRLLGRRFQWRCVFVYSFERAGKPARAQAGNKQVLSPSPPGPLDRCLPAACTSIRRNCQWPVIRRHFVEARVLGLRQVSVGLHQVSVESPGVRRVTRVSPRRHTAAALRGLAANAHGSEGRQCTKRSQQSAVQAVRERS
jgi:hypothetical protein